MKRLFRTCWCREAEGNVAQQVFEKPGGGKARVKNYLGPEGQGKRGTVKRLFSTYWCRGAEGNVPQQVFEKLG